MRFLHLLSSKPPKWFQPGTACDAYHRHQVERSSILWAERSRGSIDDGGSVMKAPSVKPRQVLDRTDAALFASGQSSPAERAEPPLSIYRPYPGGRRSADRSTWCL